MLTLLYNDRDQIQIPIKLRAGSVDQVEKQDQDLYQGQELDPDMLPLLYNDRNWCRSRFLSNSQLDLCQVEKQDQDLYQGQELDPDMLTLLYNDRNWCRSRFLSNLELDPYQVEKQIPDLY